MQNYSGIARLIIEAIQEKKGTGITVLDLSDIESAPAMGFIICQGRSTSHTSAIADGIRDDIREKADIKPYNYDGYRNAQWIVIDYGDVLVHVFAPETREFYNLEDLWSDARIKNIPDLD